MLKTLKLIKRMYSKSNLTKIKKVREIKKLNKIIVEMTLLIFLMKKLRSRRIKIRKNER